MKKLLFIISIIFSFNIYSQNTLIDISGMKVDLEEFESIFYKNNERDTVYSKDYVIDIFNRFLKFKLKVKESKDLGYDTVKSFIQEINDLKNTLSNSYLSDSSYQNKLIDEAYQRMKYEVNVSHILIRLEADALPKDTLRAYKKALSIKRKINTYNSFEDIAFNFSEDPSVKQNYGELGWFSVFRMVYPFETAAYNTPVGEISNPVKSKFGYHIIKVNNKRKSLGEFKVAHILIRHIEGDSDIEKKSAEDRINQLVELIDQGRSFEDLVQYSEDMGSASGNGELPWYSAGQVVPEFAEAVNELKRLGDISKPFKTAYGWHIVKLINKRGVPEFEDIKDEIKAKIKVESRTSFNDKFIISKIKKEYSFREYIYNLKIFYNKEITSEWASDVFKDKNKVLFKLNNKKYTQYNFAKYIKENGLLTSKENSAKFIFATYQDYVNKMCLQYEISQLPNKHPDYKLLLNEYREGILLFDISNDKIWLKANQDTVGLLDFYTSNIDKYKVDTLISCYLFSSVEGIDILKLKNNIMNVQKVNNLIEFSNYTDLNYRLKNERQIPKGLSFSQDEYKGLISQNIELLEFLKEDYIKNYKHYLKDEYSVIKLIRYRNPLSDFKSNYNFSYKDEISELKSIEGRHMFVYVRDLIPDYKFLFNEIKGRVISDYQEYLESEWVNYLFEKHNVTVDLELLNGFYKSSE